MATLLLTLTVSSFTSLISLHCSPPPLPRSAFLVITENTIELNDADKSEECALETTLADRNNQPKAEAYNTPCLGVCDPGPTRPASQQSPYQVRLP
ncbi:hypothetical protein BDW71DRAFT_51720 [Aspergillus fruticulosus]